MIFDNYSIKLRDITTYVSHMSSYIEEYEALFADEWREEDKYGRGIKGKKIAAYNAWLLFKVMVQDDINIYSIINPTIPENQIYTLDNYNEAFNCFRCIAEKVNPLVDMSRPNVFVKNKPYYYGVSVNDSLTESQILSLLNTDMARSLPIKTEGYVTEGEYIYFVYPTEWGVLGSIIQSAFNTIHEFDVSAYTVNIATLEGATSYTVVKSLDLHEIIEPLIIEFKL